MNGEITRDEFGRRLYDDIIFNDDKIRKPVDVEIQGRTLINLLGRAGNAIHKQDLLMNQYNHVSSVTYDNEWYLYNNNDIATIDRHSSILTELQNSKCYLIALEYKRSSVFDLGLSTSLFADEVMNIKKDGVAGSFYCTAFKMKESSVDGVKRILLRYNDPETNASNLRVKNIRVYEISEDELSKIGTDPEYMEERLVEKYPYVDDVKCVVNPYICSKENLISDNYQFMQGMWEESTGEHVTTGDSLLYAIPDKIDVSNLTGNYTLFIENLAEDHNINVLGYDLPQITIPISWSHTTTHVMDLTNTNFLKLGLQHINYATGTKANLSAAQQLRITLVRGSSPKSYNECHNSRIMFEIKLYEGEKITRQNNGTYVKNSEWEEIQINGIDDKFAWLLNMPGHKVITVANKILYSYLDITGKMIRYDGNIIKQAYIETVDASTETWFTATASEYLNCLVLTIPNILTGWGDSYIPTSDEIKAFFLGWVMVDASKWNTAIEPYNGSGSKGWLRRYCGIATAGVLPTTVGKILPGGIMTTPTVLNDQGYTPYRLIYKKETPTLEEVKVHGSLSKSDDSIITAGSGLILEEKHTTEYRGYINNVGTAQSLHRMQDLLKVVKDREVVIYSTGIRTLASTIIKAGVSFGLCSLFNAQLLINYLIYKPDTVQTFDYTLTESIDVRSTLNKAVEGNSNTNEELAKTKRELTRAKYELSQRSNPNLLINGDFQIAQRKLSVIEQDKYVMDRWIGSVMAGVSGNILITPQNNLRFSCLNISGVERYARVGQFIEMNPKYLGELITLSFKLKNFVLGSDGSFWAYVRGSDSNYNNSASGIRTLAAIKCGIDGIYTLTFKCLEDIIKMDILFQLNTNVAQPSVEIEWVKLELGEFATPFVPRTYAEEFAMCQRYYQRYMVSRHRFDAITTNNVSYIMDIPKMRIQPTAIFTNVFVATIAGGSTTGFIITQSATDSAHVAIVATKNSHGMTDGFIQLNDMGLDAEIY